MDSYLIFKFLLLAVSLIGAISVPFAIKALRKSKDDNSVLISLYVVQGVVFVFWVIAIIYRIAIYGEAL